MNEQETGAEMCLQRPNSLEKQEAECLEGCSGLIDGCAADSATSAGEESHYPWSQFDQKSQRIGGPNPPEEPGVCRARRHLIPQIWDTGAR
jgi:hypothetical protein